MYPSNIEQTSRQHISVPPRSSSPKTGVRRRRGIIIACLRLLTSPSAAFLLLFPTVGYYILSGFANVVAPESSIGAIAIRVFSLSILVIAYIRVPARARRRMGIYLLPATLFIMLHSYRLLENMYIQQIEMVPSNSLILTLFFLSGIVPAYILSTLERTLRDDDMIPLLSLFAVLFIVGMALNREALYATADRRLMLDKINPIALAYIASSLLLFYMLAFARSKRLMFEALFAVPILLVIVSLARSRGMLIATGIALLVYVLALRGTRRIWTLAGLAVAGAVIGLFANPEYITYVLEALDRIDPDKDMSTAGRVLAFSGAWNQFVDDPILGRFAFELQTNFYPHNIYLESLMAVGLVGTLPFAAHVCLAIRAAIGLIRARGETFTQTFVALLFIRESVAAAASGALWGVAGFWITSFLVITMWYGRRQDQRLLHRQSRHINMHDMRSAGTVMR